VAIMPKKNPSPVHRFRGFRAEVVRNRWGSVKTSLSATINVFYSRSVKGVRM
jgi:hypothetical protein